MCGQDNVDSVVQNGFDTQEEDVRNTADRLLLFFDISGLKAMIVMVWLYSGKKSTLYFKPVTASG